MLLKMPFRRPFTLEVALKLVSYLLTDSQLRNIRPRSPFMYFYVPVLFTYYKLKANILLTNPRFLGSIFILLTSFESNVKYNTPFTL